jgi:Predicted transcriptional regulators
MATSDNLQEAVDVLQQLGLKEYEARCFVGLSQQSTGTAKQLSEITDVPRTRVYDAVRVLEAQGLVEIQHSSPRKFRAVSLSEATETLRDQYEKRVDRLHDALDNIELHTADDESLLTETLVDQLTGINGDIDLLVGAPTNSIRTRIQEAIPGGDDVRLRPGVAARRTRRHRRDGDRTAGVGRPLDDPREFDRPLYGQGTRDLRRGLRQRAGRDRPTVDVTGPVHRQRLKRGGVERDRLQQTR